jgi:nucleoside-diphosphate-sugar epimerase
MNSFSNGLAIVGAKGFVGSALANKFNRSEQYTRDNISKLQKSSAQTLAVTAAPAVKWKANQYPVEDFDAISKIYNLISTSKATECILISTIDVFPSGVEFTEADPPSEKNVEGYGRNRIWLEQKIMNRFEKHLIIRLPAMYGPGLKKNVLFDLLNNRQDVSYPGYENIYEWLDVCDVPDLIVRARELGLDVLNLATEPTVLGVIVEEVFNVVLPKNDSKSIQYKMRSNHVSSMIKRESPYYFNEAEIIEKIKKWKFSEDKK